LCPSILIYLYLETGATSVQRTDQHDIDDAKAFATRVTDASSSICPERDYKYSSSRLYKRDKPLLRGGFQLRFTATLTEERLFTISPARLT
jgi:hypothetical protein